MCAQLLRSRLQNIRLVPSFPTKLKGGRLEKWKNYWMGVARDYQEAGQETIQMGRDKPYRAAAMCTAAAFVGYCVKTNPTEADYKTNYIENELDLLLISENIRSTGAENLHNYVSRAFNANLIRRLNLGFMSLMWVDDYSPELGLFAARCDYLKPGWADMRYRIVDIGFLGRWWISERKMENFDVKESEWNSQGEAVDPNTQLKQMW